MFRRARKELEWLSPSEDERNAACVKPLKGWHVMTFAFIFPIVTAREETVKLTRVHDFCGAGLVIRQIGHHVQSRESRDAMLPPIGSVKESAGAAGSEIEAPYHYPW